jgi:ssDNA-binding Zn-finger/Zn-ribbon topoisomerase 1
LFYFTLPLEQNCRLPSPQIEHLLSLTVAKDVLIGKAFRPAKKTMSSPSTFSVSSFPVRSHNPTCRLSRKQHPSALDFVRTPSNPKKNCVAAVMIGRRRKLGEKASARQEKFFHFPLGPRFVEKM